MAGWSAGCNLGCRFCQNWHISKARDQDGLTAAASPSEIAAAAARSGCRVVAFTYNDPVIFAEYAIETAKACHAVGIRTAAVTAGYITAEARAEFFEVIDAANVDLKAFSDAFYHRLCHAALPPVLDTLAYLRRETNVWLEVTTLLIPGENDGDVELDRASDWFAGTLGPDVPWHFTAFHPDFKMADRPATPRETLQRARAVARSKGLKYVYTGNVRDRDGSSTRCPGCDALVIERNGYDISSYRLDGNRCRACGEAIAGHFDPMPGRWGNRRQRIQVG